MTEKDKIARISSEFDDELEQIQIERIKNENDKKLISKGVITKAVAKHSSWNKIKQDIINFNFKNKKGQVNVNIIIFPILVLVSLLIFGALIWSWGIATDAVIDIPDVDGQKVNLSQAGADTFGQVNSALLPAFRVLSFILIFSMVLMMFFVEFLSRKNPAFLILDLFIIMIAFVLAVPLSNQYEIFLTSLPFSSTLIGMRQASSIALHLPRWVMVIGITGIIISFIGFIRRTRQQQFFE